MAMGGGGTTLGVVGPTEKVENHCPNRWVDGDQTLFLSLSLSLSTSLSLAELYAPVAEGSVPLAFAPRIAQPHHVDLLAAPAKGTSPIQWRALFFFFLFFLNLLSNRGGRCRWGYPER